MKRDVVFHNFREIIEVPNGIKRFNDLVLKLAVTGNLQLKSKQSLDNETGLPKNWSIKSFSEIASFTIGKTPPTKDSSYWANSDSIMWVSIADMRNGETIDQSNKYVTNLAKEEVFGREPWPVGTLLMSFKLTIGKMARLGRPAFFNEAIIAFDTGNKITNEYLFRVLPVLSQKADSKGAIKGNTLNSDSIRKMLIPIPPIDEQEILINIIDEISDKCQVLEQELNASAELRNLSRGSAIDAVSTAQSQDEFEIAWNRIKQYWHVIAGTVESINEMRGLILTLATSGLLVKQDLSEPKPQFASVTDTKQIPENWIWSELQAISQYGGNGSVVPDSIPRESWILDLEDIEKKTSKLLTRSLTGDRKNSSNKTPFKAGDVLYGKLRPYLDKVLVADMSGFCTTEIVPIKPKVGLDPNWLRICLKRPEFVKKVTELSYGTKMPRLGTNDAKKSVHPIPPLEEQRRIVKRVDQLMQICDQLEKELILANDLAERFSRSVVSESA